MAKNVRYAEISSHQRRAVEALAAGGTKQAAALAAGRTRRTIDRWLQDDPAFQGALADATAEGRKTAAKRLAGLLGLIIDHLAEQIAAGDMSLQDSLKALDTVARHAASLAELVDLEGRVKALEEARL